MLPIFKAYGLLLAGLPNQFPSIQSSTLTAYTIGPFAAEVEGKLTFEGDYVLNGGRCVWTYRKVWTGLPRPAPIRHPHHPGCECRHRWQWAGGGFIVAGQSLDVVVDGFQRLDQRGEPRTMGVGKDRGSSGLPPNRTGDV